MTTNRLIATFVLALASASLLYACSSGTDEPAEAASSQSIIYDGNNNTDDVVVGEAFTHEDTPSPHGYDYTCLRDNATVEFAPYGNQSDRYHETYRTFVSYDVTDAVDKLRHRLWPSDRQLDGEIWRGRSNDAETEVISMYQNYYYGEQEYGNYVDPEYHHEVVTILIYVRTLMEDAQDIEADNYNDLCDGGIDTIQDWKDDCGDSYLGREIYGGFVVLTVDVDQLNSNEREELYAEFRVDSNVRKKDHRDALYSLDGSVTFNFHDILLNGLRRPRAGLLGSGDTMSGTDVVTYLTELMEGDGNEFTGYEGMGAPGEPYAIEEAGQEVDVPETGWIIQQDFRDYPLSYIEFCGPPSDGYACYTDFFANEVQVETLYQEWLQKAEFEYESQSEYCWGPSPKDAQDRHAEFIQEVNTCNSAIAQGKTDCESAFNGGASQSTICDECKLPPSCDREKIERMRSQLFEPVRTRPNGNCYDNYGPIEGGHSQVLDDTDDSICVLSQVGGKFESTSESVELDTSATGGSGGPAWYLSSTSSYPAANTNTYGRAICVPKSEFTDGSSNTFAAEYDGDSTYNPSSSPVNTAVTNDFSTVVSLNGVSGDYDGGGEYARIYRNTTPNPDEWWFKANTNTGAMKSDWTEWGLAFPSGGVVSLETPAENKNTVRSTESDSFANGEQSRLLVDSDDALCYLVKFQGQFDGRGEWIRIDEGQNSGFWYIRARGACKSGPNLIAGGCDGDDYKRVEAEVKCYEYDQG